MSPNRSTGQWSAMARQQAAVARIGQLALRGIELDVLLDGAVVAVSETLGVNHVVLLDVDGNGQAYRLRAEAIAGDAVPADRRVEVQLPIGLDSQTEYTAREGRPIASSDLEADGRFTSRAREMGWPSGAALTAPVGLGDTPWGVLGAYSSDARTWTDDDLHFVHLMANTIALAIYRNRAEEMTESLLVAEQQARLAGDRARERLAKIVEGSARFNASLDPDDVMRALTDFFVPALADICIVDAFDDDRDLIEVAAASTDPDALEVARYLRRRRLAVGGAPADFDVRTVAASGRSILVTDVASEIVEQTVVDAEHRAAYDRLGGVSAILVPLIARGKGLGVVTLVSAASGRAFDGDDLILARELADRAALALDNGRLFESRARVARSLQSALLPPALPKIEGLELAADYEVAEGDIEIGGDFYDVIEMGDSAWGLVVGDVCGRGPDAAALTGLMRHSVRASVVRERLPSVVLSHTNEAVLGQIDDSRFCTAAFLRLEPVEGGGMRLVASSGGHPLPLILRADGTVETVECAGQLLGVVPTPALVDVQVDLFPGDCVVLFTDGLTEARRDGELFGEEGAVAALAELVGLDARGVVAGLGAAVTAWADDPDDDRAVLVARLTTVPAVASGRVPAAGVAAEA